MLQRSCLADHGCANHVGPPHTKRVNVNTRGVPPTGPPKELPVIYAWIDRTYVCQESRPFKAFWTLHLIHDAPRKRVSPEPWFGLLADSHNW